MKDTLADIVAQLYGLKARAKGETEEQLGEVIRALNYIYENQSRL